MAEIDSKAIKLKNAVIVIHGWSAGTAILNVTATEGSCPEANHASIWIDDDEIESVVALLRSYKFGAEPGATR